MLDRVHSDVCSPLETPSLKGSKYFLTFIDEDSTWVTVYMLRQKSEAVECFLEYETFSGGQTAKKN